jgi:hypothetical protein
MKLVIIETTIVAGGKVAERGTIHNTGDVDKTTDKEAYQLIAAGRALEAKSPEAQQFLTDFAKEQEGKKAATAAAEKAKK